MNNPLRPRATCKTPADSDFASDFFFLLLPVPINYAWVSENDPFSNAVRRPPFLLHFKFSKSSSQVANALFLRRTPIMALEGRPKGRSNWVDYCFKVIIIGDYKVGKTTLLCKYTGRELPSINNSVSVDFRVKTLHRGDKKVKLQIWDIGGQERFRTAVSSYYRGASGVVLVYDVTNRASFQNIGYW